MIHAGTRRAPRYELRIARVDPLGVVARRPVAAHRPDRDAAQRVPRRRVDEREVEVPDEQHRARPTSARRGGRRSLAKRKRVSRSPSQSSAPETAKRSANAAVRAAFSFWPALKRPCRAGIRRSQSRSSSSKRSSSRSVAPSRRRSPSSDDQRDRRRPGDRRPEVDVLDHGRRPTSRREPAGRGRAPSRAGRGTRTRAPSAAPARCG